MAIQNLLKLVLLTTTMASSIALAEGSSTTEAPLQCDSAHTIKTLRELGDKNRGRIYIHNIQYMFTEKVRSAVREYWALAKTCPTKEVVKTLIQEYQAIGYPNEYLQSVLIGLGSDHGLKTYELGDTWNKELVTQDTLTTPARKALFNNIAIMGLNQEKEPGKLTLYSVGTGFVLGRDGQKVYIGTARHVVSENAEKIPLAETCNQFNFHFPVLGKKIFKGSRLIVAREDIDFAVCELVLPEGEATHGELTGLALSTQDLLPQDLTLATMGFNSHNKAPGKPHIDESADCRLFFSSNQMRKLEESTWLLPTACDVASGDSGSPVVDRRTLEVLGVMVKTTIVKSGLSSQELTEMQNNPKIRDGIWQEGSLLVPFIKIRELLCDDAKSPLRSLLKCDHREIM